MKNRNNWKIFQYDGRSCAGVYPAEEVPFWALSGLYTLRSCEVEDINFIFVLL